VNERGHAALRVCANLAPVMNRLRCPECARDDRLLEAQESHLVCASCGKIYPVTDGVPRLLSSAGVTLKEESLESATGSAMVQEYRQVADAGPGAAPRRSFIARLKPPQCLYHGNDDLSAAHTRRLFVHQGPSTIVLNVGGGPRRYSDTEVTLNLEAFHNVDLVGDAHNIPLASNSVDSVICNAVLEHVVNAERVAEEMVRVLKPGGMLYAEMPFIFFFHGYPSDFRRFTREGVRRLFASLPGAEIGIAGGPVSALLISANVVLEMFVPKRPRVLRKAVNGIYRLSTFWLKYLDSWLMKREDAHLLAAGFWIMGRKPA
jgi:uncharacterized protein YbaR (Trm112 family)